MNFWKSRFFYLQTFLIAKKNPSVLVKLQQIGSNRARPLLDNLIKIYLKEIPELIQKLELSLPGENLDDIKTSAHRIKSDCQAMGFARSARIAQYIELNPQDPQNAFFLTKLKALCAQNVNYLVQFQKNKGPTPRA